MLLIFFFFLYNIIYYYYYKYIIKRIVYLLLFTKARISIVIAFSLAFLSLTQNFKCRTLDNLMVDCSRCGKAKTFDGDEIYQCSASKVIF